MSRPLAPCTVRARCSGPVPSSLRGHSQAREEAGWARPAAVASATAAQGLHAVLPFSVESAGLAAGIALAGTTVCWVRILLLPALACCASRVLAAPLVSPGAAVAQRAGKSAVGACGVPSNPVLRLVPNTYTQSWERDVGVDGLYNYEEEAQSRLIRRTVVQGWPSPSESRAFEDELWGDELPAGAADSAAATQPPVSLRPLRERAAAARQRGDAVPDGRVLRAEAIDAELKAWEAFDKRAAAASARRASSLPKALTGNSRDQAKRVARLASEDDAAAAAAPFRRKLEEALRLETTSDEAIDASSALPLKDDAVEGSAEQQRARLEGLKAVAIQQMSRASEAVADAARAREVLLGADEARELAEAAWRKRAEDWLLQMQRGQPPRQEGTAAERFLKRVRGNGE